MRLIWARVLLRVLPFRRLTSLLSLPVQQSALSGAERGQLRGDVCWAIDKAAKFLPGRTVCFPRGIVAQVMCRKRGIDTIMYYGAAVDPAEGLRAHVWVQDGGFGVVGHLAVDRYRVLARFPEL
jgi:hypothetical protein